MEFDKLRNTLIAKNNIVDWFEELDPDDAKAFALQIYNSYDEEVEDGEEVEEGDSEADPEQGSEGRDAEEDEGEEPEENEDGEEVEEETEVVDIDVTSLMKNKVSLIKFWKDKCKDDTPETDSMIIDLINLTSEENMPAYIHIANKYQNLFKKTNNPLFNIFALTSDMTIKEIQSNLPVSYQSIHWQRKNGVNKKLKKILTSIGLALGCNTAR